MAQICCFAQRQDGCVAGLVTMGSDKKPDLSTARFVMGPIDPDADHKEKISCEIFEKATNIRVRDSVMFDIVEGADGPIYIMDMDIIKPMSPKSGDPNITIMWINPWHLAVGQHGDIARRVFELNETRVAEPPQYLFRKNTDYVIDPDADKNLDPNDPPPDSEP